jgi:transposase
MSNVTTCGIDLAKNVFSLHAVDGRGVVVLRKTATRARLMPLVAQLPACVIGLESCSGAHEWALRFAQHGHTVKLMAPKFVAPYRKSGKNDGNDAEAICEAVSRPSSRAHHRTRRCVPANVADHGRPIDAADGIEAHRPARPLGARRTSAPRISPRVRGHRGQTRSYHLGDAREERVAATRLRRNGHEYLTSYPTPRFRQQVRPASAEPDQLKGHQRPTNDRGAGARLTSGPGHSSSPTKAD